MRLALIRLQDIAYGIKVCAGAQFRRWASAEEMGYPLVAIGSQIFSYMSGQVIYFDYGMSSVWETGALSKN